MKKYIFLLFILLAGCDYFFDIIPPKVKIISPEDGAVLEEDTTQVKIQVEDNRAIDKVILSINGEETTLNPNFDKKGEISYALPKLKGKVEISAKAYDKGGNWSENKIEVYYVSLSEGLVLYLSFDEGSGDIAYDLSGNGNNGTIYGATWADGISGKALQFDGVNDYVEVPDDASLDVQNYITLSSWIYLETNTQTCRVIDKWSGGTGAYLLSVNDGVGSNSEMRNKTQFALTLNYSTCLAPRIEITLLEWHFLVGTYDGSEMKIYVDGNLEGTTSTSGTIYNSSRILTIGGDAVESGRYFNGLIDEVRIYNRALTAEEIKALYNSYTKK